MTDADKLLELWERERVKKVMLLFGRALDSGDWKAYRSCFTNPVCVDFERLTGQPEVRVDPDIFSRFAELILSPCRRHHTYSNWDIWVEGDRAGAIVYMTARHWRANDLGASSNAQFGRYDVEFEQYDDIWRISRIKHDFQWIEGNGNLFDMQDPELLETMGLVFNPSNFVAVTAP